MQLRPLSTVVVGVRDLSDHVFVGYKEEQGDLYLGILIKKEELGISDGYHIIDLVRKVKELENRDLVKYFRCNAVGEIKVLHNPYLTERDKKVVQRRIIKELERLANAEKKEWERWKKVVLWKSIQ